MAEHITDPSPLDLFRRAKEYFLDFNDPQDIEVDQKALARSAEKAVQHLARSEALALLKFGHFDDQSSFLAVMTNQMRAKTELDMLRLMVAAQVLNLLAHDDELNKVVTERRHKINMKNGCINPIPVGGL